MLAKVRDNRGRGWLLATSALVVFSAFQAEAGVLPTGGAVTSGTAAITSPTSTQVTINQTGAKAIVTWSDFSVSQGNTVQFNNGSGSTLNRVTGSNASQIEGAINATGSVYLINQNGVVIGKTGVVNVGGSFVASTLDIPDASYLAGGPLTFSGTSTASVFNLGQIGASGGDVALIAQTVENDGTITATAGDVGLLAGSQVTLSDTLSAGGKFQVTLGSSSSATNTGTIASAIAELRAYGGNVYALAGNTGGSITATGVATNDGQVFLTANAPSGATGVGDVTVSGGVTFSGGANALTIDAFHNASILTPISTTGGHITLATNDGGVGGVLSFGLTTAGFAGSLSFLGGAGSGESLTINGVAYTLIYSIGDLINANYNEAGAYALANNLAPNGSIASVPVLITFLNHADGNYYTEYAFYGGAAIAPDYPTPGDDPGSFSQDVFTGMFDGLGHTVTGLTISGSNDVGFFGNVSGASISHIGLVGGNISGDNNVGGLVGEGTANIFETYSTAAVSGANYVGGLVGSNGGNITHSFAGGPVTGVYFVGGLEGSGGVVTYSSASGTVSGMDAVGGLVGAGDASNSFATGAVTGHTGGQYDGGMGVGGLIGQGNATDSYATGAVIGGDDTGGLIGIGDATRSYATGAVGADPVGGIAGGLVGNGGAVDSYATGAVNGLLAGGLAGIGGTIVNAYATGPVTGSTTGGLEAINGGSVTSGYWDTQTTGQSTSGGGSPLTTAQMLHAANFVGFDFSATGPWRIVEGASFPYLAWQFSGTPGVISGTVSAWVGGSVVGAVTVGGYADGTALVTATSGANGYYQILTAPGLLTNADVVTFLPGTTPSATALATGVTGSATSLNLYEGALFVQTSGADLLGLQAHYVNALGGFTSPALIWTPGTTLGAGLPTGASLVIQASGNFLLDQSLNLGTGTLEVDAGGTVSEFPHVIIQTAALTGSSVGGASFGTSDNRISGFSWTNTGAGGVTLDDFAPATLGAVAAGTGDLTIGGPQSYRIYDTGPLTAGGNISLSASHGIDIGGQITAGGAVTLTGSSAGGVAEEGAGAISAASLGGSANMAVLNGANVVGSITGFTTTAGVLFNDTQTLTISGPIAGGSGLLYLTSGGALTIDGSLTSTGNMLLKANGDIAVDAAVNTAGHLALYALGAVSETGSITANTLLGYSNGSTDLSGSNTIDTLAGYQVYHGGATLTLSDLVALTITAPVAAYAVSFTDVAGLSITGSGAVTNHGGGQTLNGSPF